MASEELLDQTMPMRLLSLRFMLPERILSQMPKARFQAADMGRTPEGAAEAA
jgi:hypothetical protein